MIIKIRCKNSVQILINVCLEFFLNYKYSKVIILTEKEKIRATFDCKICFENKPINRIRVLEDLYLYKNDWRSQY